MCNLLCRADRGAVLHAAVGKVDFPVEHLYTNLGALTAAILAARPKGIKGGGESLHSNSRASIICSRAVPLRHACTGPPLGGFTSAIGSCVRERLAGHVPGILLNTRSCTWMPLSVSVFGLW